MIVETTFVGGFMTSLDMGGVSLTLLKLQDTGWTDCLGEGITLLKSMGRFIKEKKDILELIFKSRTQKESSQAN